MSKGLEAYKAVATLEMSAMSDDKMTVEKAEELRQVIEKELKALEIIKEHIRLDSHKYESDETYGFTEYMFFITKEEYDLLKEELL